MVVDDERVTVAMPCIGWNVTTWVLERTQTGALEDSNEPDREQIIETTDQITVTGISQVTAAGIPERGADPETEVRISLQTEQWTFVLAELADFIRRTDPGDINEEAAEIARATADLVAQAIAASGR